MECLELSKLAGRKKFTQIADNELFEGTKTCEIKRENAAYQHLLICPQQLSDLGFLKLLFILDRVNSSKADNKEFYWSI